MKPYTKFLLDIIFSIPISIMFYAFMPHEPSFIEALAVGSLAVMISSTFWKIQLSLTP